MTDYHAGDTVKITMKPTTGTVCDDQPNSGWLRIKTGQVVHDTCLARVDTVEVTKKHYPDGYYRNDMVFPGQPEILIIREGEWFAPSRLIPLIVPPPNAATLKVTRLVPDGS